MQTLSAAALLNAWERGAAQTSVHRALLLLALIHPDLPLNVLAALPLTERDAQLVALRERLFGAQVRSVAACPKCAEPLELAFDVRDVYAPSVAAQAEIVVVTNEGTLTCRMLTSADLLALEAVRDKSAARKELAKRCIVGSGCDGALVLSDGVLADIETHLQQAHAEADAQLALHCPACHHEWQMAFDIAAFLWSEVNDWAVRLLRDVHMLARAYGWREADVLAMSARRRGLYLQLLGA